MVKWHKLSKPPVPTCFKSQVSRHKRKTVVDNQKGYCGVCMWNWKCKNKRKSDIPVTQKKHLRKKI